MTAGRERINSFGLEGLLYFRIGFGYYVYFGGGVILCMVGY